MNDTPTASSDDPMAQLQDVIPTALRVLTDPRGFFSAMPRDGDWQGPALFAGAMLVAEAAILALFQLVHLRIGAFLGMLVAVPILGAIGMLIGAAILLFVSRALAGEATFESSARIVAYATAMAPIYAVAQIVPYLSILASAYGCYLAIIAVITVHRVAEQKAWTVLGGAAAALLALSLLGTITSRRAASKLEHMRPRLEKLGEQMQKHAEDMQKAAEKMEQELQRRPGQ